MPFEIWSIRDSWLLWKCIAWWRKVGRDTFVGKFSELSWLACSSCCWRQYWYRFWFSAAEGLVTVQGDVVTAAIACADDSESIAILWFGYLLPWIKDAKRATPGVHKGQVAVLFGDIFACEWNAPIVRRIRKWGLGQGLGEEEFIMVQWIRKSRLMMNKIFSDQFSICVTVKICAFIR